MTNLLRSLFLLTSLCATSLAQVYAPPGCADGRCPTVVVPLAPRPAESNLAPPRAAAIVRVENASGVGRSLGSGTLVDVEANRGLVVTCAHLFREQVGTVTVTFASGRAFTADVLKQDVAADLAALAIAAPDVQPVELATDYPKRGDPLVSCGYGGDGRLWCNRGQALGYVSLAGARGAEVLELSGAARSGDSGGPVFNRRQQLVAVLFGTNGRVVDGTYCGRVRQFLEGLSARFLSPQTPPNTPAPPAIAGPPGAPPPAQGDAAPAVPASPPNVSNGPAVGERLDKLERLVGRLRDAWQATGGKLDALADALAKVHELVRDKATGGALAPPTVDLPPGADALAPIEDAAGAWGTAHVAALLVSLGVPGGIAGVAAGAAVYLVMRRGKQRLRAELARLRANRPTAVVDGPSATTADDSGVTAPAEPAPPAVVERHHNCFVPYEISALDKAWASAHAHVGERFPGAVPYLKIAESVKDQLLSGNTDPTISEGRTS